jgi:trehalose/maltose hydrolase-like predicted phosphorylase
VTAAEVGHLELAYDYVYEAAQIDLRDLDHNSGDGMHIASLASVWTALVAGFGGLREYQGQLSFAPQLPDLITRLCFNVQCAAYGWKSTSSRAGRPMSCATGRTPRWRFATTGKRSP